MHKFETHFIPENTAPKGAVCGVYNSGGIKVGHVPWGRMARPNSTPNYSFLALSDVHIDKETAPEDFERALSYAEENCAFTCIAGDLTDQGIQSDYTPYKNVVNRYPNLPIYAIAGNHEHYSNRDPAWFKDATEESLYYSFTHGNDVYIMVGHYGGYDNSIKNWLTNDFVSEEELKWLYDTLEENRNKRCFVFIHVPPHAHGVGDPNGLYTKYSGETAKLWDVSTGIGKAVIDLLRHYKNTILFHGHSHTRLELQELDPKANYSDAYGYRSVHIPSLAVPRDLDGNTLDSFPAESEGYVVDVYDDYIILNGRDFVGGDEDGHWIPLGTYKIDTPLHTVEAGTFHDDTGLITI